ncbi:hydantoinase/oxoprolinase family protein [Amycolatopsis echigonensis]|uniref:Hydantoinase/oxoprolinase family protein n=1 Tax=Amycolatopsis echigonensis TaxID=2576905 RepID=A0A8E2B6L6_9PSEU|nr:hydantoinase/oxoprolinase family protein [Amycolatopsis echigonensis]MBB2502352.1 hydantoinase/oxoprolinase family protein [Amycolatopsis echigonensis]
MEKARITDNSIGVDIGGTHTDLIVATADGLTRSKAFTTHDDYSRGIFDALDVAAQSLAVSTEELVRSCSTFINSSTIVTNAVTELRGAKVGVLITRGFKDTFRIARGARKADYDDHKQTTPPEVVARDCIEEVTERSLVDGTSPVALDEDDVRSAVKRLKARGVEAYAVCYLWSFGAPAHEQRTRELILEEDPDAVVMLSSEVHPVIRETERFFTAVFNCLSHRGATRFVDQISMELRKRGFTGTPSFFQGIGGSISGDAVESRPMSMLASGPAGGVMGAAALAARIGLTDVLVGDMGGTSFDTALLHGLEPTIAKRVSIGQMQTGTDIIDVVSVGSGGGSLAWIDARGVPQVGPESAGSTPGPVCYGRGGTEPTVTDATMTLGLIDPDNYLAGRHQLDRGAAVNAIREKIAEPLGWTPEQAAAGIYDLAVVNMSNALRTVSIERGHDPRAFSFFAYGGGLGLFAVEVGRRLGCAETVIPDNCSAFSAQGVLMADYVRQYNRTINWVMADGTQVDRVNAVLAEMRTAAVADASQDGIHEADLSFSVTGEGCFAGQVWEISVPLPDRDLTAEDGRQLSADFPSIYERAYGEGTAWVDAPATLVNIGVKASFRRPKPQTREAEPLSDAAAPEAISHREVFLPSERRLQSIPVYSEAGFVPGAAVPGPCIIDVGDTTVYIPTGATCQRDRYFNFRIPS